MNLGILLVGLLGGVGIAAGITWQSRAAHRRAEQLARDGVSVSGTITSADTVGRYGAYRRLTVAVDGGTFVETVPLAEATETGLVEGADVAARILPGDPSTGRLDRDVSPPSPALAVGLGLFVVLLGVAAAVVV